LLQFVKSVIPVARPSAEELFLFVDNSLLRIILKIVIATTSVGLSLSALGGYLERLVPEPYHQGAWLAGMILFCCCLFAAVVVRRSSRAKQRRLENVLLTGAVIGALIFVLFVSEIQCVWKPSALGGGIACRYLGGLS